VTDVLVEQVFDWRRPVEEFLPAGCARFLFPTASQWFLWPYAGAEHPRNEALGGREGPYPAEFGDNYLNRMIKGGVAPAAAVRRYLELDIVARAGIASRYEKEMELLDRRDEVARFGLREAIETRFRTEKLFRTRGHPNMAIFALQAAVLFARMGVDAEPVRIGLASYYHPPFPYTEMPIHPRLGEHFGLGYAGADTLYRFFPDGRYTFEEFAHRYMRYAHNLAAAKLLSNPGWPAERRLAVVSRAVAFSPGSSCLLGLRARVLLELGQKEAALEDALAACGEDDGDPDPWYALAVVRQQAGRLDEAVAAARAALARHANHPAAHRLLGRLALDAGDVTGAVGHLRAATLYAPRNAEAWTLYAEALRRQGNDGQAAVAAGKARAAAGHGEPDWGAED
jgi:tetratricopeptide (TPR) repeat protein